MMEWSTRVRAPDFFPSQSPRYCGARGYCSRSMSPTADRSEGIPIVSRIAPRKSPARYRNSPGVPPSANPVAFRMAARSTRSASRIAYSISPSRVRRSARRTFSASPIDQRAPPLPLAAAPVGAPPPPVRLPPTLPRRRRRFLPRLERRDRLGVPFLPVEPEGMPEHRLLAHLLVPGPRKLPELLGRRLQVFFLLRYPCRQVPGALRGRRTRLALRDLEELPAGLRGAARLPPPPPKKENDPPIVRSGGILH